MLGQTPGVVWEAGVMVASCDMGRSGGRVLAGSNNTRGCSHQWIGARTMWLGAMYW